MGQEVTTYTQTLSHPINVSFVCEHCGEHNSFAQEIVGGSKKSKVGGKRYALSQNESAEIMIKAQKNLDFRIKNAKMKIAKEKFSWLYANKCSKCNHYQSWQTGRIWKNFFSNFFGGPFMLLLIVMFPLQMIFGKDTNSYPEWISIVLGVLVTIIMISALVNLITSLISRGRKQHKKPTVTL